MLAPSKWRLYGNQTSYSKSLDLTGVVVSTTQPVDVLQNWTGGGLPIEICKLYWHAGWSPEKKKYSGILATPITTPIFIICIFCAIPEG